MMSAAEVQWLDAYHARLPAVLGRLLDEEEQRWLAEATQPLGQ
jgi:Xaa-Pro aminopeptidase